MKRFRRARGVSLLELLIALTILVIIVGALPRLQSTVIKGTRCALDISSIARALYVVQSDIVRDDRFLPPQEFPDAANPDDPSTLDAFLDDTNISARRCYSRLGVEVPADATYPNCTTNPAAYFRITYAKFRQPDVSFFENSANPQARRDSSFNRIPLSHYRMRVEYYPDGTGQPQKRIFASRLVTSQVVY